MIKIENQEVSYKELLVIDADADRHTCDVLGVADDGTLLFIREEEKNSGNAYFLARTFFRINQDEYLTFLGTAAKNNRLQRALSKGTIRLAVSYRGEALSVGSALRYSIESGNLSLFTENHAFAEAHDFRRIDKFEYEKTVPIVDCDAVSIIHEDAESGEVFAQLTFRPSTVETWLDALR